MILWYYGIMNRLIRDWSKLVLPLDQWNYDNGTKLPSYTLGKNELIPSECIQVMSYPICDSIGTLFPLLVLG